MSDKLKSCPFCGGAATLTIHAASGYDVEVTCEAERCPARPRVWGKSKSEAVALWNRRAEQGSFAFVGPETYQTSPSAPPREEARMTSPFLEAVQAVQHREDCPSFPLAGAPGRGMGYCNCDRDERIARGLKAVSCRYCGGVGWYAEQDRTTGDPMQVQCDHDGDYDSGKFLYAFREAAK